MIDKSKAIVKGHIKIHDPLTGEVFVDKDNAIHYENMSEALAKALGGKSNGVAYQMSFGNGGAAVDATGVITYLPANSFGSSADLYSETYSKVVDDNSALNRDPSNNKIEIRHVPGLIYSDLFVTCLLDYAEPAGQQAFDNSVDLQGDFIFDELGLKTEDGKLLTHVVFHPVQKSLNRQIQIDYTVRIQSLTNLSSSL